MVTHQGESTAGELNPDLMASAGVQSDADQTFFSCSESTEFQPCFFNATPFPLHNKYFIFKFIFMG